MFLICSRCRLTSPAAMDGGIAAMDCKRCGGSMMPETVIKLRRSLLGFRETRSQGAYCATCKTGILVEESPLSNPAPPAIRAPGNQLAQPLDFLSCALSFTGD